MTVLTIGERIILHLGRYDMIDPDDIYNTPWDLTQDGIASSLRISRAHASIELKKLRMADKVVEKNTHIKGGKSKRKSYFLTPLGLSEASRIKDYVKEEGIDFMPLLDMKRCDPNALLDSFDEESKFVLGLACVLRCSVKRDELPETKQSVVPIDVAGNVVVSNEVKAKILSVLDPEHLSKLHSTAADYWLTCDEPDRQERLYHLVKAGRIRDACRLVVSDRSEFLDDMNEDLNDILSGLHPIPEKYVSDILTIKIATAVEFDDVVSAKLAIEELLKIDEEAGTLYLADLELAAGRTNAAIDTLNGIKDCKDIAALNLRKARCLADLSKFQEAKELLEMTKIEMNRTGNVSCLNDVYLLMSTIFIRTGCPDDAVAQLNKAKSSAGERDMKKIYQKMSEAYAAKGIMEEIKRH